MNVITIAKLYDLLCTKLGRDTAENLTNFIETKINQELESKTHNFATKADIAKLESKIGETNIQISQSKSEIMKWMFIFWVSQVMATFGFILLFLRK